MGKRTSTAYRTILYIRLARPRLSLPAEDHDVVGQGARQQPGQRFWKEPRRQYDPPRQTVGDTEVDQSAFRRDPAKVHFEQRRDMSRVASILERVELVLQQQRELAEEA